MEGCVSGWPGLPRWWAASCRWTSALSNFIAPLSPHFKMIHLFIQAALSIFGMISGPLLGLYLLGMLFRTTNSTVSANTQSFLNNLSQLWLTRKLSDGRCFYPTGRTDGNDGGPGADPVGGDRRPDLPAAGREDQALAGHHLQLQQQRQRNGGSLDHSPCSKWVSLRKWRSNQVEPSMRILAI